jgi:hypothetical protein
MSDFPTIHPRERIVNEAEIDLAHALLGVWEKHDLTDAEMLRVVAAVFGRHVASNAKYRIREERHGDTDKPGGWA